MALKYTEFPSDRLIEVIVDGKVTEDDLNRIMPQVEAFIADGDGPIRMVEVIRSFSGLEASALWSGLKFDLHNIKHIARCAVVSDLGWIGPITTMASAVMPTTLRTFKLEQADEARVWALEDA